MIRGICSVGGAICESNRSRDIAVRQQSWDFQNVKCLNTIENIRSVSSVRWLEKFALNNSPEKEDFEGP